MKNANCLKRLLFLSLLLFCGTISRSQSSELKYHHYSLDTLSRSNSEEDRVVAWEVDSTYNLVKGDYHESNKLLVLEYKDSSGNGGFEYYDKDKNRVLKRYIIDDISFELYYVFDAYDRIGYILPPQFGKCLDDNYPAKSCIDLYTYQYRYDSLNRIVAKRIPGSDEWEFLIYDNLSRLVLTRSPGQADNQKWSFTKFDSLDRPVIIGQLSSSLNVEQMRKRVQSMSSLNETINVHSPTGYSAITFPKYTLDDVELISYYGDQSFLDYDIWKGDSIYQFKNNGKKQSKSLYKTGELRRVIGTNKFLKSVKYYNQEQQLLQSIEENNFEGFDRITNEHYSHGLIKKITHSHYGYDSVRIEKIYSHSKYKTRVTTKIDDQDYTNVIEYNYADDDKLIKVKISNEMFIDYEYDSMDRLIAQNFMSDETFAKLRYEYCSLNFLDLVRGQQRIFKIDGSIKSEKHNEGFENIYTFDSRNQIKKAVSSNFGYRPSDLTEEFSYDLNGNITSIKRKRNNRNIDDLYMSYSGNRLSRIVDKIKTKKGFIDNRSKKDDFLYDKKGSVTVDLNRDIKYFYSGMYVPHKITSKDYTLEFKYLKDMTLLSKKLYSSRVNNIIENEYFNGIEYENKRLKQILFQGGAIVWLDGNVRCNYFFEDNTRKIRAIISDRGVVTSFRNYGPFDEPNELIKSSFHNSLVKYSNAHVRVDLSVNDEMQFQFRHYLPQIGRFLSVNPLAELDLWSSPYQYGHNNASINISPFGLFTDDIEN
ncbi:MAG: hypothetical protein AAGH46_01990 [Bacteroidota bacterium]